MQNTECSAPRFNPSVEFGRWCDGHRGRAAGERSQRHRYLRPWGDQPYALDAKLSDSFLVHLILPDSADGRALEALATGTSTIAGDLGENWSPVSIETELNAVELTWGGHTSYNTPALEIDLRGDEYRLNNINLSGGATKVFMEESGKTHPKFSGEGLIDMDLLRMVVPGLSRAMVVLLVRLTTLARTGKPTLEVELDGTLLRHSFGAGHLRGATRSTSAPRQDGVEVRDAEAGLVEADPRLGGTVQSEN